MELSLVFKPRVQIHGEPAQKAEEQDAGRPGRPVPRLECSRCHYAHPDKQQGEAYGQDSQRSGREAQEPQDGRAR